MKLRIRQPAHLLRPKDYSRFGLGELQVTSRRFFFPSMLIRVASAVVFSVLMYRLLFNGPEPCRLNNSYPDVRILQAKLARDAASCVEDVSNPWCPEIRRLQQCGDRDWAGLAAGLPQANNSLDADCGVEAEALWLPGHCEDREGSQMECLEDVMDPTIWVRGTLTMACAGTVPVFYYCEILLNDTSFSFCDAPWGETELESLLQEACRMHQCKESIPPWLAELTDTQRNRLCACQQCSPFWTSRQCIVEAIDGATRSNTRIRYWQNLEFGNMVSDPFFVAQTFIVFLVSVAPLLWLLSSLAFSCCTRIAPWAVPFDPDLHERVQAEEKRVYEELMTGSLEASRIDRFCIFLEVAFILLDVVTDLQMIWIYYSHHHYIFAAIQGLLVLRSFVEQLRYNLFAFFTEARDSVRLNLRTDALMCILQSEKTGEATLSFLLQTYACFYLLSDVSTYWTTAVSLMISVRGITKGCYIHFDLAFGSSEGLPPIVAETDEKEESERPPPEDDPPKLEVSEQEVVEPPPPSRTVEALIQQPIKRKGMSVVVPV